MVSERDRFARKLRQQSTKPEDILWTLLRGRKLGGVKFRRQIAILGYTVDFLSFERRLIIELDGRQHDWDRDYDAARTEEIERHGFMLLRFRNHEVLNDPDAVVARIGRACTTESPLLEGEGLGEV
ncbi:endonuclease domain-containing protein [Bosea sp. NPDC003192]|uniref:endonuclease domain-containing protein n=1 Tax=Bosea sp. NPDC003192 TaxID=3390551 RepID=UPI003CFD005C